MLQRTVMKREDPKGATCRAAPSIGLRHSTQPGATTASVTSPVTTEALERKNTTLRHPSLPSAVLRQPLHPHRSGVASSSLCLRKRMSLLKTPLQQQLEASNSHALGGS